MSRLSKNIIYNILGQSALLFIGFIAVKYIFNELGEDALGIIYFSLLINAVLIGALDKGIYSTVVREIASYIDKEPSYIVKLIQTGLFL